MFSWSGVKTYANFKGRSVFMNGVQKLNTILMTIGLGMNTHLVAQTDSDADLAQDLTNPIANLITVPIQINFVLPI